jgi:hypothetical protein
MTIAILLSGAACALIMHPETPLEETVTGAAIPAVAVAD